MDDSGVRVAVPMMTEESRKDIVKVLKKKHEEARVTVRSIRQTAEKAIEAAEKNGDFAEDDKFRFKDELQKFIDEANKGLDEVLAKKEGEVMSV